MVDQKYYGNDNDNQHREWNDHWSPWNHFGLVYLLDCFRTNEFNLWYSGVDLGPHSVSHTGREYLGGSPMGHEHHLSSKKKKLTTTITWPQCWQPMYSSTCCWSTKLELNIGVEMSSSVWLPMPPCTLRVCRLTNKHCVDIIEWQAFAWFELASH